MLVKGIIRSRWCKLMSDVSAWNSCDQLLCSFPHVLNSRIILIYQTSILYYLFHALCTLLCSSMYMWKHQIMYIINNNWTDICAVNICSKYIHKKIKIVIFNDLSISTVWQIKIILERYTQIICVRDLKYHAFSAFSTRHSYASLNTNDTWRQENNTGKSQLWNLKTIILPSEITDYLNF